MTPEQKSKIAEVAMALVTIAKDEYSRRRNMPKSTKSDEYEIDQLLELPKDVEIRCGLDNEQGDHEKCVGRHDEDLVHHAGRGPARRRMTMTPSLP